MIKNWRNLVFCVAIGGGPVKTASDWLQYSESQMRGDRSKGEVEMTIETENWKRVLEIKADIEGKDKSLVFIQSPAKEKGIGTLRLGGNMWNYFPKLKRKVTVSPSMLLSSWMGSDFTNDDLLKASSVFDDYLHDFLPDETIQGEETYKVIQNTAKPTSKVVWPKIITLSSKKDCIPRYHRYYDKNGALMRTLKLTEVKKFDGHVVPSVWTMIPEKDKTKKTVMIYKNILFKTKFPENHFSMQTLTGN